jgi:glutamine synthetase
VLAAILSGMEHGLDAGIEPIAPLNEDRGSGIDFPKDMLSAVAAMQVDPAVREGMGREFVMVYCENKRQEELDFRNEIGAREYRWYL